MAMVNGLGYDRALQAITLDAGPDPRHRRTVSAASSRARSADLVLLRRRSLRACDARDPHADPGQVVYDRGEYLKLPYARRALPLTGGGGVGCCLGW